MTMTYIQQITNMVKASVHALHSSVGDEKLEEIAMLIYMCMSQRGRYYHNVCHIFGITAGCSNPIILLSALFHDVVYVPVDDMLPPEVQKLLSPYVEVDQNQRKIALPTTHAEKDSLVDMIYLIFGFSPGVDLSCRGGNEFLSAIVAVRSLEGVISRKNLMKMAVCIEATIPFRKDQNGRSSMDMLYKRLCNVNKKYVLDFSEDELVESIKHAVDLANRDVGGFHSKHETKFLEDTWNLLTESNYKLRFPLYTINNFCCAIREQYNFFSFLRPELIFSSFRNHPDEFTLKDMTIKAAENLECATSYLRVKLLAASILAAIATLTGGDVPISFFVGDRPSETHRSITFEDFLLIPRVKVPTKNLNMKVYQMFDSGRAGKSLFDIARSPLSAYIYIILGESGVDELFEHALLPMDATCAKTLLSKLPRDMLKQVTYCSSKIAQTRAIRIKAMYETLKS